MESTIIWRFPSEGDYPNNREEEYITKIISFGFKTTVGAYIGGQFLNISNFEPFNHPVIAWAEFPKYEPVY